MGSAPRSSNIDIFSVESSIAAAASAESRITCDCSSGTAASNCLMTSVLADRVKKHHDWVARMKKDGREIPKDRTVPTDLRPGPAFDANRPGNCYAGMLAPLEGLAVKGAIFHQGYNNCFKGVRGARMYRAVFPEMIRAWRAAFNDPELPFGIISLCGARAWNRGGRSLKVGIHKRKKRRPIQQLNVCV